MKNIAHWAKTVSIKIRVRDFFVFFIEVKCRIFRHIVPTALKEGVSNSWVNATLMIK